MPTPILYSFRRCPYAMRARLAIAYSAVEVELREVVLKNKPAQLIAASAKATVPVLLEGERVVDESLDVMYWALQQRDPDGWLELNSQQQALIEACDREFKPWLDKYKYADRHPEHTQAYYRSQCEVFFKHLEAQLAQGYLGGDKMRLCDAAIFPFIRQCAHVDLPWFETAPYPQLRHWLKAQLASPLFTAIMHKYSPWVAGSAAVYFPEH
ncbi:MAG: glutathione S-transferase [Pseudomonadales bacterium]